MKEEKEKIPENTEQKESGEVTRRGFLVGAGTVVVGGAIGAGLLSSCGDTVTTTIKETSTKTVPTTITAPGTTVTETKTVAGEEGEVITVTETTTKYEGDGGIEPWQEEEETHIFTAGLGGGGGDRAVADVKNGKIIRVRPLHYDWKYTKEEFAPSMWKWDFRGKVYESSMKSLPGYFAFGYKHRAYSPNRVLWPLKRVDFDPNGERNPQNRGKSKYKRISWDEATDIIASEIKRIHDEYGTKAIYCHSRAHGQSKSAHMCHGSHTAFLGMFGPYTTYDNNPDSWEGFFWGGMHVAGTGSTGHMMPAANVTRDVAENSKMIVHIGSDWETTTVGFGGMYMSRMAYYYTELGIKQIYICPDLSYAVAVHADKWLPVFPNTDAALLLAVIYTWLDEDAYDKDYVDTHTEGADEFFAYVRGEADGVPKTPAWASPKCGIPEWTIKAVAREWADGPTSIGHHYGGSMQRGPYSHEPARLCYIALGMQGVGKPGIHQITDKGFAPRFVDETRRISAAGAKQWPRDPDQKIPLTKNPEAILNPPVEWWGHGMGYPVDDQFNKYSYPDDDNIEIRMYWTDCPCATPCWNHGFHWIESFRSPKIEFMLAQHPWFEGDCQFADIVMPGTSVLEDADILQGESRYGGEYRCLWLQKGAIERVGETCSDYEVVCEIAKKIEKYGGIYADAFNKYTEGLTIQEKIKRGFEGSGVNKQGLISWEEWQEKGYYCCPIAPDYENDPPGLREFYLDPEANPRDLPSGKLEFTSQRIRDVFGDDDERGPYPKWVPGGPGPEWAHDESLEGERCKTYPFLIVSNHPRWRHHVQADDIPWIRELPTCKVKGFDGYLYEPIWINPIDAKSKNIKSGDIVKVFNERGVVLVGAFVTERIKPGVVLVDHGTRSDIITDGIDRGGCINLICPYEGSSKNVWGQATSGYLVDFEKLDYSEMQQWREDYPEVFAKDYDPGYGLTLNAWLEGGK